MRSPGYDGPRGTNVLDGGAPFFNVYTCKDGAWMSVACAEPKFFKRFLDAFLAALPSDFALVDGWRPSMSTRNDKNAWPKLQQFMEAGFLVHPRDYWTDVFHGEHDTTRVSTLRHHALINNHLSLIYKFACHAYPATTHRHGCMYSARSISLRSGSTLGIGWYVGAVPGRSPHFEPNARRGSGSTDPIP